MQEISKRTQENPPASVVVIPTKSPKQCYHLQVIHSAPIDQVTLGGHTFVKQSTPISGFDRSGKAARRSMDGIIEALTTKEFEAILLAVQRTFLRTTKIPKSDIVSRVEVITPSEANPMDPDTDTNVAPYIRMEPCARPIWWDENFVR